VNYIDAIVEYAYGGAFIALLKQLIAACVGVNWCLAVLLFQFRSRLWIRCSLCLKFHYLKFMPFIDSEFQIFRYTVCAWLVMELGFDWSPPKPPTVISV